MKKKILNEWLSVSDEVKTLANYTAKRILNQSNRVDGRGKAVIGRVFKVPYVRGSFDINIPQVFGDGKAHFGLDELNVSYIVHIFMDEKDYKKSMFELPDSTYNDNLKRLTLNLSIMKKMNDDDNPNLGFKFTNTNKLYQDVYHEMCHAFQYSMGFKKHGDLYQDTLSILKQSIANKDDFVESMARMSYYCFSHEQDSFAHQFYAMLDNMDENVSFEEALGRFNAWKDFAYALNMYQKEYAAKKSIAVKIANLWNMDIKTFNKRIESGKQRFYKKLSRAYIRHYYETKILVPEHTIKEGMLRRMLQEEYGKYYDDIKFDYKVVM